jgi:hypothetical protein
LKTAENEVPVLADQGWDLTGRFPEMMFGAGAKSHNSWVVKAILEKESVAA